MTPSLTPGVYEVNGEVYVVKPTKDKQRLYAKRLVVLHNDRVTQAGDVVQFDFEYDKGAILSIRPEHQMPLERAKELAIRYGRCINCGRVLKTPEAIANGLGPVCIKAFRSAAQPRPTPQTPQVKSWWSFTNGVFVSEASTLQGSQRVDPFGGDLGRYKYTPKKDREGEVTGWDAYGQVNGQQIHLMVLND